MKISAAFAVLLAAQPSSALIGNFFKPPTETVGAAKPAAISKVEAKMSGLPPKNADNKDLQNIFYQNQAWKKSKLADDPAFFQKLGSTHKPEFMYIGCVDARVPPELIMGQDAGNMFVHRNVANMVVNTDTNLLSALQYGVSYLKVQHVIVCGHYECGGVKAGEANNDFVGNLEMWVRNVRDVYADNRAELDAIQDADKRHRRLVDLNVIQQAVNVLKSGAVQARRKETYQEGEPYTAPLVHAMVFDPKNGELKRLDIDFSKYEDELTAVYGLHLVA